MGDQQKELNKFKNLTIVDGDEDDENSNESSGNGRLEKILTASEELELLERTRPKSKQQQSTASRIMKPIQPKPTPTEIKPIVLNNLQFLNNNNDSNVGPKLVYDASTGRIYQLQQDGNLVAQNLIQVPIVNNPQPQININNAHDKVEMIKNDLAATMFEQQFNSPPQQQQFQFNQMVSSPPSNFAPASQFNQVPSPINQNVPQQNSPLSSLMATTGTETIYPNTPATNSSFLDTFDLPTPDILNNINTSSFTLEEIGADDDVFRQLNSFSTSNQQEAPLVTSHANPDERDICEAEINLLPTIENIVKLRKDRGETFVHQLAQSKQIMHTVSGQALRRLYHRDNNLTGINLRLTTCIFMESIIRRALRDQVSTNQSALLYNIVNIKNSFNETPISLAIKKDREDFVKLVLENGANPNIFATPSMHTALHRACIHGSVNSFKVMMQYFYLKDENRATINQLDADGNTCMALAIKYHAKKITINNRPLSVNNLSIIKDLVDVGADLLSLNFENDSYAHLLCSNSDCSFDDRLRLFKILKINMHQLTEQRNIHGKTAWECWTTMKPIDQPQMLLASAQEIPV